VILATVSRAFRKLTGDAWVFEPIGALIRVAAMAAALAFGVATGRVVPGALAAGGAFLVGFGASLDLFESHPLRLAIVALLSSAAAIAGSVAASNDLLVVLVAAGLGAVCGAAASRDAGRAWIALQCALAGVVATTYPASFTGAAARVQYILAGGIAQAVVLSVARLVWRPVSAVAPRDATLVPRYALHLAIALGMAMALERAFHVRNGYWVPMTTLLVLRPGTRQTMLRAISRTFGTVGGAALASAVILTWHPSRPAIAALVVAAAGGSYVFHRATYGLFSACVTIYAVALLSFLGQAEREVAVSRIVATLLGAAIGLGVQLVDSVVAIVERGD
jgi:hypothetical protein